MVSRPTGPTLAVLGAVTLGGLLTAVLPLVVVLGALRLVGVATLALGAWLLVGRTGLVDLATGAAAGAGAYLGGVLAGLTGMPALAGLVTGAGAGAVVSAVSAGVGGRVGRRAGALTSLALAGALVALLEAWSAAGGAAGYHAVPLLTGGDRSTLAIGLALLLVAALVVRRAALTTTAAAAATAVAAPEVASGLGRRAVLDTARIGAVAGAVLGLGGALQAFLVGSVHPGGYGLGLAAALALAALLGGAAPAGPVVGALLLWGPGVIWPLAPVVGSTPVLLGTGLVGLALLAARRSRALLRLPTPDPVAGDTAGGRRTADVPASPPVPPEPCRLVVRGARYPGGEIELDVAPGEVVFLVGPNGAGKSTLLARIGGQLPDHGSVRLGDRPAPTGARARARSGVARTWQRPPSVAAPDALTATIGDDPDRRAAAAWARQLLGGHATTPTGAQLVRLAAARPSVALLDEPAAALPAGLLSQFVRSLADGGAAVLVAEHRPEVVAVADRVLTLGGPG